MIARKFQFDVLGQLPGLRRCARSLTSIDAEDLVHDAQSMSASAAQALFRAFCAIMGLALSPRFSWSSTGTSIARTFLSQLSPVKQVRLRLPLPVKFRSNWKMLI